jgi:hypothetical protein
MNTVPTSDAIAPVRSTFIRFLTTKYVKSLVKEAKRVKYTVGISRDSESSKGNIYLYEVFDPEHNNSLVFKSIAMRPNYWATTFSKVYWQEPVT